MGPVASLTDARMQALVALLTLGRRDDQGMACTCNAQQLHPSPDP
jgi:hypothetical protein